jgi:hypothetical protein
VNFSTRGEANEQDNGIYFFIGIFAMGERGRACARPAGGPAAPKDHGNREKDMPLPEILKGAN